MVAIAIPVFTKQLEKSREATDCANMRSTYADAMTKYLTSNSTEQTAGVTSDMSFTIKQNTAGWESTDLDWSFMGKETGPNVTLGKTYKVKVTANGSNDPTVAL